MAAYIFYEKLKLFAIFSKNHGFKEEKEWRIISSPTLQESKLTEKSIEVVRGIPQTVLKIKLKDFKRLTIHDFSFKFNFILFFAPIVVFLIGLTWQIVIS